MAQMPTLIAEFLRGKRVAVAGVSRGAGSAANPVYRKLRDCGYDVFPVNPNASEVEGARCYPDLASISSEHRSEAGAGGLAQIRALCESGRFPEGSGGVALSGSVAAIYDRRIVEPSSTLQLEA